MKSILNFTVFNIVLQRLASQLAEVEDARRSLENALDEAKLKSEALKQDLRNSTDEHLSAKELLQKQMSQHRLNLLGTVLNLHVRTIVTSLEACFLDVSFIMILRIIQDF